MENNMNELNGDLPPVTGLAAKGAAVNVVELFSGIGGFTKGLMDAGMKINKHYYSEIDKHAIANYKYNFKDAEYIGSVTDVSGSGIERPNIITFGSPCQDFSLAGKRKGMEGQRSSLILHAIRLIGECRPDFFIWENVKGAYSSNDGADFWGIIQAFANIGGYRLEWQLLNTSWFLPQNRERIYLIGHLAKDGGDFKGIFPFGEGDQWDGSINGKESDSRKRVLSNAIDSNYHKGADGKRTMIQYGKGSQDTKLSPTNGNSQTLNAGHYNQPKIIQTNKSGQQFENDYAGTLRGEASANYMVVKSNTEQGFEVANEGDSIDLKSKGSKTRRGVVGNKRAHSLDAACNQAIVTTPNHGRAKEREYDNTCPALQSQMGTGGDNIPYVNNIRRLTEIECERLQGFPDNWTEFGNYDGVIKSIPKTQRYKLLGNAVTVNVVKAIGCRLLAAAPFAACQ